MESKRSMNIRVNSARQHHELYYPRPHPIPTTSSCKGCCCCLFLLFSFCALLLLAALLVIVLAVKPKRPHLHIRQAALQYMAQSYHPGPGPGPGPGPPNLYLMIRLVFAVVNPNGVGMRCGESRVTLLYRGTPLGNASVSGFWQRPHSVKEVVATVGVDDVNLSNSNADAADFTRDAFLNDRVELLLSAHLATRIRLLNLPSPPLQVSMNCIIVISPRKQSLTYEQCGLKGLNV